MACIFYNMPYVFFRPPKWCFYLGLVCAHVGDYSQAAVYMEELYKSEHSDEIDVILGDCYKETGMTEKALKTAFEKEFRCFDMVKCAPELANVRKLAEFNGLVNEYKAKMPAPNK